MKTDTKLRLGGIALLVVPALILTAFILYQLSQMDPPSAGQLKLKWAFIAFYTMAAGLVLLIFARGAKQQERKNADKQKQQGKK